MSTSLRNLEGRTFGSWQLSALSDAGGMGAIFQGRHAELGTRVAIKVLLAGEGAPAEAVIRFQNEAKIGANVVHPNIARTLDMFRDDQGRIYVVMEWLDGESLAKRLKRGPCALPEAHAIFSGVCRALAAAHKAAIVHRDVKPANIYLAIERGELVPKLIDFGIARLNASSTHTRTGLVMGSPPYMSPEQWRGAKNVTVQSDVFALGVVFYEMLTGQNPFSAETVPAISVKIATMDLPPHPNVPPALHHVLLRATARAPAARIATAEELFREVALVLERGLDEGADSPAEMAPVRTQASTLDATTARALRYTPPVLVDEHALGDGAAPERAALRHYLLVAAPLAGITAASSWALDLPRLLPEWTSDWGASTAIGIHVGVAAALGLMSVWLGGGAPAEARSFAHWARRAASSALLVIACWALLIAVCEAWAALQSSLTGVGWRRDALRREIAQVALGAGLVWFAGLGFGALITWVKTSTRGEEPEADPLGDRLYHG